MRLFAHNFTPSVDRDQQFIRFLEGNIRRFSISANTFGTYHNYWLLYDPTFEDKVYVFALTNV